jgi:hypothetical protein
MDVDNIWAVKLQGIRWAVKKGVDNTLGAPLFPTRQEAVDFAITCAKSNTPSRVEIYRAYGFGEIEQCFDF